MKKIFAVLVMLLIATQFAWAQEPYALHISQTDGLPSNSVYTIFQDSKGYIWLATDAGLTKYDGFQFRTYKCDEQTSTAGSCIKEDKYGRIWYENFDGYLYYVSNDSLHALNQKNVLNYLPFGMNDRHILVMQKKGIDVYDLKTLQLLKTIKVDFTFVQSTYSMGDNFYFIANNYFYYLNKNFELKKSDYFINTNEKVRAIYSQNDNLYVIAKHNEKKLLYIFDKEIIYKSSIRIEDPELLQGSAYIDSAYWIYSTKGVYVYENDNKIRSYFKDKSISTVLKDVQGNYWFSTTSEGIFLIPSLQKKIHLLHNYLPNKIAYSSKGFLVGCKRGELLLLSKDLNSEKKLVAIPEKSEIYLVYADPKNDNLFYSAKGLSIAPNFSFNNNKHSPVSIKELQKLDDKYYACAASSFFSIIESPTANKNQYSVWDKFYKNNPKDELLNVHFADNIRGKTLAYDSANKWIYYSGNIGFFKKTIDTTVEIKHEGKSFFAAKIVLNGADIYTLSTKGNLYKITNENNFELLNTKLGLHNFEIKSLWKFDDYLFFLSNRSVHYIHLKTNKHHTLDISINPLAIADLYVQDSSVFILINEGLVVVPLQNETKTKQTPPFYIYKIIAGKRTFENISNLVFKHQQNDVSIHFSILDYGNKIAAPIYYKINEEDWKLIPPDSRTLSFLSLAHGAYTIAFRVHDLVQKEHISFTIKPPYWQEWWFISLGVLLFLLAGYIYYRWRIGILSNQIMLLNEKVALEQSLGKSILTSIKSQMNPHFFYNALNTIQAYIFTNDKQNASLYLGKFSKLTRMILEMSEKELIPLTEEIKALTLYLELEKMRFDEGDFHFEIIIDPNADIELLKIPSMLVQPYAENAIKHGLLHTKGHKTLLLHFQLLDASLQITIDDNGIGRKKSGELNKIKQSKHHSFSTNANHKRLEILNKHSKQKVVVTFTDKEDQHGNPLGTTITIHIPTHIL